MNRAGLALLICAACGSDPAPDVHDAAPPGPDGNGIDGGGPDAGPDLVAPQLIGVTPEPGTTAWLHEPFRFELDEAVALGGADITATVDGSPIGATLALSGPRTVVVTIAPAARELGTLELRLAGVRDLAGNVMADPVVVEHDLPPWASRPIDRGVATTSPEIAVTTGGAVIAAWTVGAVGARRLVISRLASGTWDSLGGELGGADVASPAVAVDPTGAPIAGWIEAGQAHVARWDGAAWQELASPAAGDRIALATAPDGGDVVVAVFGASATVRALVGDSWQSIGAPVAIGGPVVGEPALAVGSPTMVAIGWIDVVGGVRRLRAHRHTASWTAITPIVLDAAATHRMDLAARGSVLAITWDQTAGSSGVLAAQLTGAATTWTRLGRLLDVDAAASATAPAIAIDASDAPIVSWTELIETNHRGVVARWSGSRWTIVGGISWLPDPGTAPAGARLALHTGGAPVVGWAASGAIGIARLNGPRVAGFGIAARESIAGCGFSANNPPATVLQTGCFTIPSPGIAVPHAGLVPYDIVSELWSDGARKRRWIALPDGGSMTGSATGAWAAPNGTVMIKEFALETTTGDPTTRRAIETRFLVRDPALGWQGFTYRWRSDGTNADLLTDGQVVVDWPTSDGPHSHYYPSRSQCLSCHNSSYGPLLGVRPQQLARWADYDGVIADQLATLAHLDVGPTTTATPWIAPHDPSQTAEDRMRGYMAANCAHCHNPDNIAIKDLRYTTPLAQTRLCEVIEPGSPANSRVYQLVTSRPGMPALGSLAVDPVAEQMLKRLDHRHDQLPVTGLDRRIVYNDTPAVHRVLT